MTRRKTDLLKSLLICLAAMVVCALLLELAVRLVLPQPYVKFTSSMWEQDPPRRFRMVPGAQGEISAGYEFAHSVSINSLGMRGPEVGSKQTGEFRILVLGDSFTFGHGVAWEDTFVALLEERLRSRRPETIVLNGGVSGYGPVDELTWLEHYGLPLQPDLVLVAVCLGNDFKDAMAREITDKVATDIPEAAQRHGISRFLFLRSHLYRLVVRATPIKLRLFLGFSEPWTAVYMRDAIEYHQEPPEGKALESRKITRAAFEGMSKLATERGFRVAAMLIPNDFHLVPELWNRLLSYAGLEPGSYAPDVPERYFEKMLGELEIPVLDLSPLVAAALEKGEKLHYRSDPHWTPAGHHLAAEALDRFLSEQDQLSVPRISYPGQILAPATDSP